MGWYNGESMKLRLSRKARLSAAALVFAILGGMTAHLFTGTDDVRRAMEEFRIPDSEYLVELRHQMEEIEEGGSVDEPNETGDTPLMNAARVGALKHLDYLLIRKARLQHRNAKGQSATDVAGTETARDLLRACEEAESAPTTEDKERMRRSLRSAGINPDDLTQALFDAVSTWRGNNTLLTAQVLALGGNANAINSEGKHILQHKHRNTNTMVLLLRHGSAPNASTDKQGGSAALALNINESPRNVRNLLTAGASVKGAEVLARAAGAGDAETVEMLLEHGADPNGVLEDGTSVLASAVRGLHRFSGHHIREGIPACVKLLLEAGAATETPGRNGRMLSPISPGGMSILPECLQLLVDAGADVNALNNRGANYAQITVYKDPTPETLKLLEDIIVAGVDLTHKDDKGESFIFYAIPSLCKVNIISRDATEREQATAMLERLLEIVTLSQPDPAALDRNGNTVLHLAAIRPGPATDRVLKHLLKLGVKPDVRNKFGRTALEAMLRNPSGPRCAEVARMLKGISPEPESEEARMMLAVLTDDTATLQNMLGTPRDRDFLSACLQHAQSASATDMLLKASAGTDNLEQLIRYSKPEVAHAFAENGTATTLSSCWGYVETPAMAKAFIKAGVQLPGLGDIKNTDVLSYLISRRGDLLECAEIDMGSKGLPNLPLETVVKRGDVANTRLMLQSKAPVNGYRTSLLALTNNAEIAGMLLAHQARIDWRTPEGETLLSLRRRQMKSAARRYFDNPDPDTLREFRAHYEVSQVLEQAGAPDKHPRAEEFKQLLRQPECTLKFETVEFVTPEWSGPVRVSSAAMVMARATGNTDTANVLEFSEKCIRVKWDKGGFAYLIRKEDGRYHEIRELIRGKVPRAKAKRSMAPYYFVRFINERNEEDTLRIHPNGQYARRVSDGLYADILDMSRGTSNASIRLRLDDGREQLLYLSDKMLHVLNADSAKHLLREDAPGIPFKEIKCVSDGWDDTLRISQEFSVAARCSGNRDAATVLQFNEKTLKLKWDGWGDETFTRRPDRKYHSDQLPAARRNRARQLIRENSPDIQVTRLQLVHPDWSDTLKMSEADKIAVRTGGTKDAAEVLRYTGDSITLKWDSFGNEVYERRTDGRYHLKN